MNGQTIPTYSTQNGGPLNATTATLNANQTYQWKVRAVRGTVTGPWSALGTFTIRTAPNNAPSLISPGVQETEVGTLTNFTWSGAPQATSYDLQVVQAPGGTVEDYSSATDSFILPETSRLRGDRPHFWRVRGRNELGAGPWTVQSADFNLWRGFRTRLNQPVHTSPAFGAQGVSRNPTLQWQPTTGVDGYNVQLWIQDNTQPGGMRELPARYGSTTATSFMIGGNPLQAGTLYYWRVEADGPTTTKFSDFWYFITHP